MPSLKQRLALYKNLREEEERKEAVRARASSGNDVAMVEPDEPWTVSDDSWTAGSSSSSTEDDLTVGTSNRGNAMIGSWGTRKRKLLELFAHHGYRRMRPDRPLSETN